MKFREEDVQRFVKREFVFKKKYMYIYIYIFVKDFY